MPADSLPFTEAIAYLASKVDIPSQTWTDMLHGAHVRGFTVAGATSLALVNDFHQAVTKMIAEGRTLADFRKEFDRIVATHGWSYKGSRGWRSAVIYNTNLRMAHAVGTWAQINEVRHTRPYLRYSAIMDGRTRKQHADWHGTILDIDNPFWEYATPPNGWNCRCTIQSVSEADLKRYGWTVSGTAPELTLEQRKLTLADGSEEAIMVPDGIDTGFGYNPGAEWTSGAIPPQLQHPLEPWGIHGPLVERPPLPPARPVDPSRLLPDGLADGEYVDRFLAEFEATQARPVLYRDAAGTVIPIARDLFVKRDGTLKVTKQDRQRYLLLLADAIKEPDEIWAGWVKTRDGSELRRRYLTRLDLPDHEGAVAVFEWGNGGWYGVTIFPPDAGDDYLESQRIGALLYRKA